MNHAQIERCLSLLREADAILMAERELSLAVHLSLVIERLAERTASANLPSSRDG